MASAAVSNLADPSVPQFPPLSLRRSVPPATSTSACSRRRRSRIAPMACGVMAREPARRVVVEASSARAQKRARDSLDGKAGAREGSAAGEVPAVVVPAPGQRRLQERMKAELEAVRELHRKAVLLCRSGAGRDVSAPGAKRGASFSAAGARREAPPLEAVAKRRKTEVAHKTKEPAKERPPVHRGAAPPVPERKTEKTKEEVEKRRRMEEIARAREMCPQQVLEVEMTALADETIYRRDLEELGITGFEYVVTRTRNQAMSQDVGRSRLVLVGS